MKEVQLYLLFTHPEQLTNEDIFKQLTDFSDLNLHPNFKIIAGKKPEINSVPANEALNRISDIISALVAVSNDSRTADTMKAREKMALITYVNARNAKIKDQFNGILKTLGLTYDGCQPPEHLGNNIRKRILKFIEQLSKECLLLIEKAKKDAENESSDLKTQDNTELPQSARFKIKLNQKCKWISSLLNTLNTYADHYPAAGTSEDITALRNRLLQAQKEFELFANRSKTKKLVIDESALENPEITQKKGRLINIIAKIEAYLEVSLKEQNRFINKYIHNNRKTAKIDYCENLLQLLENVDIKADSDISIIINQAHQDAKAASCHSNAIAAGGSYFGTSRLLGLQQEIGITEALAHGKSKFLFFQTTSKFHGLKVIEKSREPVEFENELSLDSGPRQ